jgi:integration host factor subunit alpha
MQGNDGGKTITKAELIEAVYEKVGFSKKESSEIVEKILETMKFTLEAGKKLKISGFGKFEVRFKNTRRGRNPQTNMELQIPAHRVVSFKPSQVLKAAIAGEPTAGLEDDMD